MTSIIGTEKGRREVVMTKVEEMVAKARINNHILRIMTPINLITRSLDVKVMVRGRRSPLKGMDATYAVGRMTMQVP